MTKINFKRYQGPKTAQKPCHFTSSEKKACQKNENVFFLVSEVFILCEFVFLYIPGEKHDIFVKPLHLMTFLLILLNSLKECESHRPWVMVFPKRNMLHLLQAVLSQWNHHFSNGTALFSLESTRTEGKIVDASCN